MSQSLTLGSTTYTLPTNMETNWGSQMSAWMAAVNAICKRFTGTAWDGDHPIFGTAHIWEDATGDWRTKDSAPTSDLDGTVIGGQS